MKKYWCKNQAELFKELFNNNVPNAYNIVKGADTFPTGVVIVGDKVHLVPSRELYDLMGGGDEPEKKMTAEEFVAFANESLGVDDVWFEACDEHEIWCNIGEGGDEYFRINWYSKYLIDGDRHLESKNPSLLLREILLGGAEYFEGVAAKLREAANND